MDDTDLNVTGAVTFGYLLIYNPRFADAEEPTLLSRK